MKYQPTIIITFLSILLLSCNPECDDLLNIRVDSLVKQQNQQMLVMADDPASLQSSEIQFVTSAGAITAKTTFMRDMGLLVTVPESIQGDNIQLVVNDPDCGSAILGSGITVGNTAFFKDNPSFVAPAPLEFVIPTPPVAFPPLVQNAWVSPQDLDYCIWLQFVPQRNSRGDIQFLDVNGVRLGYKETINIDPAASFELSVQELLCDGNPAFGSPDFCTVPTDRLYHCNPVSGIVDRDNNIVHFWIDRQDVNGENLGIEEYVGEFIDITDAGYAEEKVPECAPTAFSPPKLYLILVTSQTTGRQLLIYQLGFA